MQETVLTSGLDTQTDWIKDAHKATGPDVVFEFKGERSLSPGYVIGIALGFFREE